MCRNDGCLFQKTQNGGILWISVHVVVRKRKSSMEIDLYIWHNTDIVFPCVRSEMMSVLMAQGGQRVFWQQILGLRSLNSFILTVLENLQSWGDFLLILWTTLGSCSRSEEMTFPSHSSSQVQNGGVQKFSFQVHKFIIVHAAVCLSYINGIVEIVQFICVILQLRMPFLCCHSQCVCMYCITESRNAFTRDFEIIVLSPENCRYRMSW